MAGKVFAFLLTLLIIVSGLAGSAFALSYNLYDGWGGTWHDADKTLSNTEDDLMCWAAAASNVLAWTGWGYPSNAGFVDHDDMFGHFQDHWTDNGRWMEYGWNWWFDGTPPPPGGSQVDMPGGGNFWPTYHFEDYFHEWSIWEEEAWDGSAALPTVDAFLHSGYGVTLGIYGLIDDVDVTHAITVWGYDYDSDGNYLGIHFTDSDDDQMSDDPPDSLDYISVIMKETKNSWYLDDYYGSDWLIGKIQALDQAPVPEPGTILLLGSGLIALGAFRRRQKNRKTM